MLKGVVATISFLVQEEKCCNNYTATNPYTVCFIQLLKGEAPKMAESGGAVAV